MRNGEMIILFFFNDSMSDLTKIIIAGETERKIS